MKKVLMVIGVVISAAAVLGVAGYAYAQTQDPPDYSMDSGGSWAADGGQGVDAPGNILASDTNDLPYTPRGAGVAGGAGPAWDNSAQAETYSPGIRNGMGANGMMGPDESGGPLADYMLAAYAEAFGLTLEEVAARFEAGDSLWDIASSQGLTIEEYQARLELARTMAINQALADGVITQEQADWMLTGNGGPAQAGCNSNEMGDQGVYGCPGDYGPGRGPGGRPGNGNESEDNQP